MNVYSKLQKCRVLLQNMNLTKSGKNTFAGYDYFELGDFMPSINELFDEHGLFGYVSFNNELASLTILNTDKPEEQVLFTSPMSEASLKGCHAIQNVGAVETYQRRYLYTTALEIVEHDPLDKTTGKDAVQTSQKPVYKAAEPKKDETYSKPVDTPVTSTTNTGDVLISAAQKGMVRALIKEKSIPEDTFKTWVQSYGVSSSNDLKKSHASAIIKMCQEYVAPVSDLEELPF